MGAGVEERGVLYPPAAPERIERSSAGLRLSHQGAVDKELEGVQVVEDEEVCPGRRKDVLWQEGVLKHLHARQIALAQVGLEDDGEGDDDLVDSLCKEKERSGIIGRREEGGDGGENEEEVAKEMEGGGGSLGW